MPHQARSGTHVDDLVLLRYILYYRTRLLPALVQIDAAQPAVLAFLYLTRMGLWVV